MFLSTERRRVRRRRARGAAMVEAVIVLSTMLVFLGTIVWTRNSYATKLDMQQGTRSSSLYYASHGCSGKSEANASMERSGTVPDSSPQAENAAKKSNAPGAVVASRALNTALAKATGQSSFQAVWDANGGQGGINLAKQALSRRIEASSKVTCNEQAFPSKWQDWFQFGVQFITGGIGKSGSLFQ